MARGIKLSKLYQWQIDNLKERFDSDLVVFGDFAKPDDRLTFLEFYMEFSDELMILEITWI